MQRLIDADALNSYVTELYEYDLRHHDADEYTEGRASAEHYILEKIRELPTIDAIPVEWLRNLINTKGDDVDKVEFAWIMREWQKGQEEQEAKNRKRDYEAAVEMAEYCERYEPTYNTEDGSM